MGVRKGTARVYVYMVYNWLVCRRRICWAALHMYLGMGPLVSLYGGQHLAPYGQGVLRQCVVGLCPLLAFLRSALYACLSERSASAAKVQRALVG